MEFPEAQQALNKAKIQLMENRKAVFFSTLALSLKHTWDDTIPTAKVSMTEVRYNPNFFLSIPEAERVGVILHEVLHPALEHMSRIGNRDPKKFNYAADYAVNDVVLKAGFRLPPWVLYDPQFEGMTAEKIYDLLPDPPPDFMCDIEPSNEDPQEIQKQAERLVIKAALAAKQENQYDNLPGQFKFYVDKLLDQKLPWRRILQRIVTTVVREGYSLSRPNKKYLPDLLMPTRWAEQFGEAAVFVDTSGSVSDDDFAHFTSETYGLLKQMRPKCIQFGQFDTDIKSVTKLHTLSDFRKLSFIGRGGTDTTCVMKWAVKNKPHVLIIFTDGYFPKPEVKPKCPVIWVIYENPEFKAPFGKVIHFENAG